MPSLPPSPRAPVNPPMLPQVRVQLTHIRALSSVQNPHQPRRRDRQLADQRAHQRRHFQSLRAVRVPGFFFVLPRLQANHMRALLLQSAQRQVLQSQIHIIGQSPVRGDRLQDPPPGPGLFLHRGMERNLRGLH